MKKLLIAALILASCTKQVSTSKTQQQTNTLSIVSTSTAYYANNNYYRKLNVAYDIDTAQCKYIEIWKDGVKWQNITLVKPLDTITITDHYSCQCVTYYHFNNISKSNEVEDLGTFRTEYK